MCNSYAVTKQMLKQAKQALRLSELVADWEEDWRLIRPTLPAPVVTASGEPEMMRWGFHRPFSNAINNTRSDKLASPVWRDAFLHRRCIIPVASFYEYTGPKGDKRAHLFRAVDDTCLWAAGIWEENETLGRCFSMIMTDANPFVSTIHDRMPALLHLQELEPYLAEPPVAFAPSTVDLQVADAANPLKRNAGPMQQELF